MAETMTFQRTAAEAYAEAQACGGCVGGERWYLRKHAWIKRHATKHGKSLDGACAVYAILSQNSLVTANDRNFVRWCKGDESEIGMPVRMSEIRRRLALVNAGDIAGALTYKTGIKIPTFAGNLRWPHRYAGATIDRHASDALTFDRVVTHRYMSRVHGVGYRRVESQYIEAADLFLLLPHEVQARVWVHWLICQKGLRA